jgi:RNA polymerase sigma-70 factor, ECF subfamily
MGEPVRKPRAVASETEGFDEALLIERIQNGDTAAFEQLVRRFAEGLLSFAYAHVESVDIAEDLVQDVFVSIWGRRTEWAPRFSLKTYLYTAVLHRVSNFYRHRKVESSFRERLALERQEAQLRTPPTADALLTTAEFETHLLRAVDELPPKTREVFKLTRESHLTYKEVASMLGITVKTVEFHMSRAFRSLRARLADFRPDR